MTKINDGGPALPTPSSPPAAEGRTTSEAPERIWAWCFQSHADGEWGDWGGYARQDNRFPMDARERATGAEYIRADLVPAPSVTIPEGRPDLNLAAWLDRRREQIGPWADYIIAEVGKLEQEIADARAQIAASFREGVRRGVGYAAGDLCEDEGCPHHGVRHTHTDDLAAPADAAEALRQIKAEAYRAGQEAMREKSILEVRARARHSRDALKNATGAVLVANIVSVTQSRTAHEIEDAIRDLPIEDLPEDQG